MSEEKKEVKEVKEVKKVKTGVLAYIALAFAILFFSGLLMKVDGMAWLKAFDYTSLIGKFGTMTTPAKATFRGMGGFSARDGFIFALYLTPSVMLALGVMDILEHYGAMRAAQRLLTPLLRPILGVPGSAGLAMITDLQSTDAGAVLSKALYDEGGINTKELTVISAWQYSGAGLIANYFVSGPAIFGVMSVPVILPLVLMFVLKFVGGMLARVALNTFYKEDFQDEQ
jgi:nucleoside recognition membrane protein YjiH